MKGRSQVMTFVTKMSWGIDKYIFLRLYCTFHHSFFLLTRNPSQPSWPPSSSWSSLERQDNSLRVEPSRLSGTRHCSSAPANNLLYFGNYDLGLGFLVLAFQRDEDSITFLQPAQMQFFILVTSSWQNQQMFLALSSRALVLVSPSLTGSRIFSITS